MLINGKWAANFQPVQGKDDKGGFVRKNSSFRSKIGTELFPLESGRYHLIAALICPWASRTLAVRKLKGLEQHIPLSIVEPYLTKQGWRFGTYPGSTGPDTLIDAKYLHQFYSMADPDYSGRATVPVLWDTHSQQIVNNESSEIIKMFNSSFDDLLPDSDCSPDLYPEHLRAEIDSLNEWIYPRINNGVYRTGFATTQEAYNEAASILFSALDKLEQRLQGKRYVVGDQLTLADIHLFPTLVRFDAAYHGLFKANLKRIQDYPNLFYYMQGLYQIPALQETVNIDHIKTGYYSIEALNPWGIVPLGAESIFENAEVA